MPKAATKPTESKPTAPQPSKLGEPVPIKSARFHLPTDVPGKDVASSVTAEKKGSNSWKLHYMPAPDPMAFHLRVIYKRGNEPEQVAYVNTAGCVLYV